MLLGLLTLISVTLFAAKINHETSDISTFPNVTLTFAWPFYLRVTSGLLALAATVAVIRNMCHAHRSLGDSGENSILVISNVQDSGEDSQDEAENGVLL